MKKIYFTLTLLLLFSLSYSQIGYQSGYGDTTANFGKVIITNSHNEYCIVGPTGINYPDSTDVSVFFVDADGILTNAIKIGLPGNDIPTGFVETSDNGYIIVGTTYASPFDTVHSDIFACKMNYPSGFLAWTKFFGGSNDDEAYSIEKTSGGSYLILGSTMSFGTVNKSALALKINNSGEQLWSNLNNASQSDYFSCADLTTDHKYIIGGGSYNGTSTDNYFVKMDTNGSILWSRRYGSPGADWINDIQVTSDNKIIATGITSTNTAGDTDQAVLKLDTAGNLLWNFSYGNAEYDRGSSILETTSGNYLVCGYTNISTPGTPLNQMVLNEIDNTGSMLWTNIYGDSVQATEGYSVTSGFDGGYAAAGLSVAFGEPNGDVLLVKTDYVGYSGCFEFPFPYIRNTSALFDSSGAAQQLITVNADSVDMNNDLYFDQYSQNCYTVNTGFLKDNILLRIYPNPSNGFLQIESDIRNMTITIQDQSGRILSHHQTSSTKTTLDINSLPPGIYFLEFKSDDYRVLRRFVRQ